MHEKKIFTKRCFHSFAACPLPLMVGLWECGSTMAVEAWETWWSLWEPLVLVETCWSFMWEPSVRPVRKSPSKFPPFFCQNFSLFFCHKNRWDLPHDCCHLDGTVFILFHFLNSRSNFGLIISHRPARSLFVDFCTFSQSGTGQKNILKNCPPISFSFFIFSSVRLFRFCFDFCLLDSKLVETCLEVSAVANEYIIQRLNKSTPNLGGVQTLISNHSRLGVERTTWTEFSRLSDGKSRRGGMRMNFEPIRCIFAQIYAEKLGNVWSD